MTKLVLYWFRPDPPTAPAREVGHPAFSVRFRYVPCGQSWAECYLHEMRKMNLDSYFVPRWIAEHDYGRRVAAGCGVIRRSDASALIYPDAMSTEKGGTFEDFMRLWSDVLRCARQFPSCGIAADNWCDDDPPGTRDSWFALCAALIQGDEPSLDTAKPITKGPGAKAD